MRECVILRAGVCGRTWVALDITAGEEFRTPPFLVGVQVCDKRTPPLYTLCPPRPHGYFRVDYRGRVFDESFLEHIDSKNSFNNPLNRQDLPLPGATPDFCLDC